MYQRVRSLLFSALFCACQFTAKAEVKETREVEKAGASRGVIVSPNGDIELEGRDTTKATIEATKYASARSSDEALSLAQAVKLAATSGDELKVEVVLPEMSSGRSAGADLSISAPAELPYSLE